nr:hypothetical protein Iba_chr02eCG7530 [Ipomoea batatas]
MGSSTSGDGGCNGERRRRRRKESPSRRRGWKSRTANDAVTRLAFPGRRCCVLVSPATERMEMQGMAMSCFFFQATLATGCRCSSSSSRRREGSGGITVRTGNGRGAAKRRNSDAEAGSPATSRISFGLAFGNASLVMEESRRSGDGGGRSCFLPSAPARKSSADLSPLLRVIPEELRSDPYSDRGSSN